MEKKVQSLQIYNSGRRLYQYNEDEFSVEGIDRKGFDF